MQAAIDEERQEGTRVREEMLSRADRDKETLLNRHADTIARLVDDICSVVVRTEPETDKE
jgi:hypothetical protein